MYRYSMTITACRITAYLYFHKKMTHQQLIDIDAFHEDLDQDVNWTLKEMLNEGTLSTFTEDGTLYYKLDPTGKK